MQLSLDATTALVTPTLAYLRCVWAYPRLLLFHVKRSLRGCEMDFLFVLCYIWRPHTVQAKVLRLSETTHTSGIPNMAGSPHHHGGVYLFLMCLIFETLNAVHTKAIAEPQQAV